MDYDEQGNQILSDEEKELKEAINEDYEDLVSYERLTGTMS